MIGLSFRPEPVSLAEARVKQLPIVRTIVGQGQVLLSEHIDGYQVVRPDLHQDQLGKCSYCERRHEEKGNDVEHYRPKVQYWWLAWDWDNLLFACQQCNRFSKRAQFPLAQGSQPLTAEQAAPGSEVALLLDPRVDNPFDHIRFVRITAGSTIQWIPLPRTIRGQETINVLQLNRPGLLDFYRCHVNQVVQPAIDSFLAMLAGRNEFESSDQQAVLRHWHDYILPLLSRDREFLALTHDAIDQLTGSTIISSWNLPLPLPPI